MRVVLFQESKGRELCDHESRWALSCLRLDDAVLDCHTKIDMRRRAHQEGLVEHREHREHRCSDDGS